MSGRGGRSTRVGRSALPVAMLTSIRSNAVAAFFGDRAEDLPRHTASEDFSGIPTTLGTRYTYWGIGGIDLTRYQQAVAAGRVSTDIPVNHNPASPR